jgi:hypothetical protein
MEIQFSQHDSARALQPTHDFRIVGGHAVCEQLARRRRVNTGRVDVVLQSDWNPVQRSAPFPVALFRFHLPRGRQGLIGGDRDERIQGRVEPADTLQAEIGEIDGR